MKITPKEAHEEAIRLLREAVDAADMAHSYFRDARTEQSVETGSGPYRVTMRSLVITLDGLLKAAQETICDDCGKPIAECPCEWSNREVA